MTAPQTPMTTPTPDPVPVLFCTSCGLANRSDASACRGCSEPLGPPMPDSTACRRRGRRIPFITAAAVLTTVTIAAVIASSPAKSPQTVSASQVGPDSPPSTSTTAIVPAGDLMAETPPAAAATMAPAAAGPLSPTTSVPAGNSTNPSTRPTQPSVTTSTTVVSPPTKTPSSPMTTTLPAPPIPAGPAGCPTAKPTATMTSFAVPAPQSDWYYPAITFTIRNSTEANAWIRRVDYSVVLADGRRVSSVASLEQTYLEAGQTRNISLTDHMQATSEPVRAEVTGLLYQWEYPHSQCSTEG